ncbi:MAG: hypothetical protein N3B21_19455 [Clostridia bacterium]|nr:hypothetical protein [Clostridia bacterium]
MKVLVVKTTGPAIKPGINFSFFRRPGKQDKKLAELMNQYDQMKEKWAEERRHKDAERDKEKDELLAQAVQSITNEERIAMLIRELQSKASIDNCDTSHRIYLTGEQYDLESYEVKNKYRLCPLCGRFYNKEIIPSCRCTSVQSNNPN